jgi:hypothetical protein
MLEGDIDIRAGQKISLRIDREKSCSTGAGQQADTPFLKTYRKSQTLIERARKF